MALIVEFVKNFVVPGNAWFLMLAGSIGAALLYGTARMRKAGRAILSLLLVGYWGMSVPLVATALQGVHPGMRTAGSGAPEALPVVVLGNGLDGYSAFGDTVEVPLAQTAMNTLYALNRYRRVPSSVLIASGGSQPGVAGGSSEAAIIAAMLRASGVPGDRILLEPESRTTQEQAMFIARMLEARGDARCILVTSPQQMSRAAEGLERRGISVVPLAARAVLWPRSSQSSYWWRWLIPSSQARTVSRDVLYEAAAWSYYRTQGWLR